MNFVALKGRLTRDVELRKTKGDVPVISFTLAVNRDFKDSNGERQADFINCIAWRSNAEFIDKYFSKGQEMLITDGTIQTRKYEDKDGNPRTATEVVVNKVEFSGFGGEAGGQRKPEAKPKKESRRDDDDEMPF